MNLFSKCENKLLLFVLVFVWPSNISKSATMPCSKYSFASMLQAIASTLQAYQKIYRISLSAY